MAALTVGLAGLSFGLSDETGGVIQNIEVRLNREKAMVKNAVGGVVGATYYNPLEEITFEFYPTGSSNIAAASPGASITLANYTPGAGSIYSEEVTTTRPNTDYKKMSVKAMVHPLI